MPLKFGTSGVRGLVTEMTDLECFLFARAFLSYSRQLTNFRKVYLAGDFRSSTLRICSAIVHAIEMSKFTPVFCGRIGTPAVTLAGIADTCPSIMVTGSHIPDDRNGIKFNLPWGEVLKRDERFILSEYDSIKSRTNLDEAGFDESGSFLPAFQPELPEVSPDPTGKYLQRFLDFFQPNLLAGKRIVVYQHSSVSREVMVHLVEGLGGEAIPVGWSDTFVAVDTEAVHDTEQLSRWVEENHADALISTDGDGDRPLLVADTGKVVHGDLLGILVARYLDADSVSIPVSCNSAVERSGRFDHVFRTRIGSPYVIDSMEEAIRRGFRRVVGFEANGGFLTGTAIAHFRTGRLLSSLPTRDAMLPLFAALALSVERASSISQLLEQLPSVYTFSGILRKYPLEIGHSVIARLEQGQLATADDWFGGRLGKPAGIDFTDGARITFQNGEILHLRPSGNAPEFRCYAEAGSEERARENSLAALEFIERQFPRP